MAFARILQNLTILHILKSTDFGKSIIQHWKIGLLLLFWDFHFIPFLKTQNRCAGLVPEPYYRYKPVCRKSPQQHINSWIFHCKFGSDFGTKLSRSKVTTAAHCFSNGASQWHTDSVPSMDHARHKSTLILPGICYENTSFLHPMKRNIMIIGRFYAPLESDAAYQISFKFICVERVLNACGIDTDCIKNTETSR